MIALHARRSAASIQAWASAWPDKPLTVVLASTDLYRDIHTNADARQLLALASHLVVLQASDWRRCPKPGAMRPSRLFLDLLQGQCAERAPLFAPQTEKRLVINLLACAAVSPACPPIHTQLLKAS